MSKFLLTVIAGCFLMLSAGCGDKKEAKTDTYDGSKFLLSAEPAGGQNVKQVFESAKDDDEVVIIGRIGGEKIPWIKNRAAFRIVDPSLLACSDKKEDGEVCNCPTPWDYCCETDSLPGAMVLVKFVEADGNDVKHDARHIFEDLQELETVVVKGKASRDEEGNLTVLASGMYVRR